MNPKVKSSRDADSSHVTKSRGSSRTDFYLNDDTITKMIASFGPVEYSQFAAAFHPHGTYSLGEMLADSEGPIGWRQESLWKAKTEQNQKSEATPVEDSSRQYLLQDPQFKSEERINTNSNGAKKKSLLEWFDRSVEKELQKRRNIVGAPISSVDPALAPIKNKHLSNLSKKTIERLAETSASRIEIVAQLETDFTTELTAAVEKLAKAEAMCNYAAALQAAEEAAQNAPPELREQAAAAGAKQIQTELSQVKQTIDGPKPIEVVGYVGITNLEHQKKT